jgi:rhodanese-related sulfurtransferase
MNLKTLVASCVALSLSFLSFTAKAEAPDAVDGAVTVSVLEAYSLHKKGAIFIDVRDRNSWETGHVEGALHLDFTAEEFIALYSNDAIDRSTPIVFYCNSSLHNAGAMASYFAAEWGYSNVYFFRDGYYSWLAVDAPMTMGKTEAYLSETQIRQEAIDHGI